MYKKKLWNSVKYRQNYTKFRFSYRFFGGHFWMSSYYASKRSESLLSAQAMSPEPYWICLMCQIACNKEMSSGHFYITLVGL